MSYARDGKNQGRIVREDRMRVKLRFCRILTADSIRRYADSMLTIQIEYREGLRLIHLSGPLDSSTRNTFKEMMEGLVNQPGFRVVLDCENVVMINSQVLGLLGYYNRLAGETKSFLGVAALDKQLAKIIERLGMGKLVPMYATVDDAIKASTSP